MIYYAGIGARTTPATILCIMHGIGRRLANKGWVLRSGEAVGADTAFKEGAALLNGKMELFLPWKGFNGSNSNLYNLPKFNEAMEIAKSIHPAWFHCSVIARKLLARSVFQILGASLDTPSSIVIGWTLGKGGTAFTFSVARKYHVPVLNLRKLESVSIPDTLNMIDSILK